MNQKKQNIIIAVCVILIVVGIGRLIGSGGDDSVERDAYRVFACQACGDLNLLDSDMIRAQYDNNQVKAAPGGGAVFTCPSCNKQGARAQVLDFDAGVIQCEKCGKTLLEQESDAKRAIAGDEAKLGDRGQLSFRCPDCEEFSGHMVSRAASTEE